jgi:hypothetical protein
MIIDYVSKDGIMRRVQIPDSGAGNLDEGIPKSLPIDNLFLHMPVEFRRELVNSLWDVGLIEPYDFLQPGAAEKVRAALLSIVKHDAMSILAYAKESI